jgi:hypothetical protein
MKTFMLTVLSLAGLALIWIGDLRWMLTGLYLVIDVIGVRMYLDMRILDDHLALVGTDMLTIMDKFSKTLDELESRVSAISCERDVDLG